MTTVEPAGPPVPGSQRTITYYPLPNYEKEVRATWQYAGRDYVWATTATIQRSTYFLGGQAIATRISGDPTNNGLFFLHVDHLGSTSFLTDDAGSKRLDTVVRYFPFGEYRTTPSVELTEMGFTGHHENRDLGLTYMNARYYVSSIGRFASADTLVPDPAKPMAFNRYTYSYNNPLRFLDPSGHVNCDGVVGDPSGDCQRWIDQIQEESPYILFDDSDWWTSDDLRTLLSALQLIWYHLGGRDVVPGIEVFNAILGWQTMTIRRLSARYSPNGLAATMYWSGSDRTLSILDAGFYDEIRYFDPADHTFVEERRNRSLFAITFSIAHELGHIFETTFGFDSGNFPRGDLQGVEVNEGGWSPNAARNSSEDFAETFAYYATGCITGACNHNPSFIQTGPDSGPGDRRIMFIRSLIALAVNRAGHP
jgi:RHS repeat-associated protein